MDDGRFRYFARGKLPVSERRLCTAVAEYAGERQDGRSGLQQHQNDMIEEITLDGGKLRLLAANFRTERDLRKYLR